MEDHQLDLVVGQGVDQDREAGIAEVYACRGHDESRRLDFTAQRSVRVGAPAGILFSL